MSDSTNRNSELVIPEYNATQIEEKWQKIWEEESLYKTEENPDKPKK